MHCGTSQGNSVIKRGTKRLFLKLLQMAILIYTSANPRPEWPFHGHLYMRVRIKTMTKVLRLWKEQGSASSNNRQTHLYETLGHPPQCVNTKGGTGEALSIPTCEGLSTLTLHPCINIHRARKAFPDAGARETSHELFMLTASLGPGMTASSIEDPNWLVRM